MLIILRMASSSSTTSIVLVLFLERVEDIAALQCRLCTTSHKWTKTCICADRSGKPIGCERAAAEQGLSHVRPEPRAVQQAVHNVSASSKLLHRGERFAHRTDRFVTDCRRRSVPWRGIR